MEEPTLSGVGSVGRPPWIPVDEAARRRGNARIAVVGLRRVPTALVDRTAAATAPSGYVRSFPERGPVPTQAIDAASRDADGDGHVQLGWILTGLRAAARTILLMTQRLRAAKDARELHRILTTPAQTSHAAEESEDGRQGSDDGEVAPPLSAICPPSC